MIKFFTIFVVFLFSTFSYGAGSDSVKVASKSKNSKIVKKSVKDSVSVIKKDSLKGGVDSINVKNSVKNVIKDSIKIKKDTLVNKVKQDSINNDSVVNYKKILNKMINKDSLKKIVPIDEVVSDISTGIDSIERNFKLGMSDKCPSDMVYIEGVYYYFDHFGKKLFPKKLSYCIDRFEYPNIRGRYPVKNVTLYQAKKLCKQRGKRLCKDSEWQLACRSTNGSSTYAYGKNYNEDKCNSNYRVMTKSGDFYQCHTSQGVFDMSGNLAEWTNGGGVGAYGGSYRSQKDTKCTSWTSYELGYKSDKIGFRCCTDIK